MSYHYILSIGLFNVKNIKTRKNVMLPVSFLTVTGDDNETGMGNRFNVSAKNVESILGKLLKKRRSILSILKCEEPDELKVYNSKLYTPKQNEISTEEIDPYLVDTSISNMVIEIWDPTKEESYYTFSSDIRWNLTALDFSFFASEYYMHVYGDKVMRSLEGYLELIFQERQVETYYKHAKPEIRFRNKERVADFKTTCWYNIMFMTLNPVDVSLLDEESTFVPLQYSANILLARMLAVLFDEEAVDRAVILGNEYTLIDMLTRRIGDIEYNGNKDGYILLDSFNNMICPCLSEIPLILVRQEEVREPERRLQIVSSSLGEEHDYVEPDEKVDPNVFDRNLKIQADIQNIFICFHKSIV